MNEAINKKETNLSDISFSIASAAHSFRKGFALSIDSFFLVHWLSKQLTEFVCVNLRSTSHD